jgi:hypothetical protein
MKTKYITDPKEIYTLELEKLQRCFSELTKVGEGVSELSRVSWKQVECLRQMNFIIEEATMTGNVLLQIGT